MLNEYAYCPRLFHLMHVEGRWADNVYTEEGRGVHNRVDRFDELLPDPEKQNGDKEEQEDRPPVVSRSVSLQSENIGITSKLDLVSTADETAVPVETKRGTVPDNPQRSWEPERVQLMAQGLLLRENGYLCDHGVLYYAGSRTRVDIEFTAELETRTRHLIEMANRAALNNSLPPPLDDSPKCNGCSLAGICLPDETLLMRHVNVTAVESPDDIRKLYPARDDALPVYVEKQGALVCKKSESLIIKKQKEKLAQVRLADINQLVLCGNVSATPQAVHMLCEAGIPIVHMSRGHWFYGMTSGNGVKNSFQRASQFKKAENDDFCLALAVSIVTAKGMNQRLQLRRNGVSIESSVIRDMADIASRAAAMKNIQALLGIEGSIASLYFENFSKMLKGDEFKGDWAFSHRNRRPPKDPVNVMLSYGYAILAKECTIAVQAEGLDPWWGFYHKPRHGRPSLALDLMEEFRPLVVDSSVITAINTGMVHAGDFRKAKAGCMFTPRGKKAFLRAFEARMDQLVTHPVFNYRCSWRSVIRLQARLLARYIRGDINEYVPMTTR